MASQVARGPMAIGDENQHVLRKKATVDGTTTGSKTLAKKGESNLGSRKALRDITNKATLNQEATSKKKGLQKEEFNVAEESFLHDHQKCIEAQQAAFNSFDLNLVLPGLDSLSTVDGLELEQAEAKGDLDSPRCYPEPAEYPMSELSDWFGFSSHWSSPSSSPMHWDDHECWDYAWQFEEVEFVLKEETV